MPCYHPIPAYQDKPGDELRLSPPVGTANLEVPCGSCLGCKTSRATAWAKRAEHEAGQWENNCFLTLTYDEAHLPKGAELEPRELQLFLKRLRRARDRNTPGIRSNPLGSVRYLASGEYGERGRPHYHILLFNCGWNDAYRVAKDLYESPTLKKLWDKGGHRLGTLTGASANYVAQYTLKKVGAQHANKDGEIIQAPFMRASLRPAIGHTWMKKYKNDLSQGYLVAQGRKTQIPRSYLQQLARGELIDRLLAETVAQRAAQAARGAPFRERNRSKQQQLEAMERIHQQKVLQSSRTL